MTTADRASTWGGAGDRSSELPPPPSRNTVTGLDVISQNEGDLPRRRDAVTAAADVVGALFRLVKLSTMHSTDNTAVVQRVEEMVETVRTYAARTGRNVSILFLEEAVFIGGLLLQANRSAYDCARELGTILGRVGVSEVGISREARAADFFALANTLGETLRAPRGTRAPERPTPRIRLRAASALALRRDEPTDKLDPVVNAANAYASACVVMRRLYEGLGKGQLVLPHRVKRVAQRLVDLSAGEMPAFLGVTDAKRGGHDEAQRAVNASILTLAMARQITNDPVLLSRLAMAALLVDLGRFHAVGAFPAPGRVVPQLGAEQEHVVPAATAMLLTAMGRVNEPSVVRTVMAYEACWVSQHSARGLLYDGARNPTLQAFLVAIPRAYVDGVSASIGSDARTADDTIASLSERWPDGLGRTALRLLIGALGLFPSGTLVELSTGEVAAVVTTPADPSLYSMPRVRVVLDMAGHPVDPPFEVDLANPEPGTPARAIRRVVTSSMDAAPVSIRLGASPSTLPRSRTSLPPAVPPGQVRVTTQLGLAPARGPSSSGVPSSPRVAPATIPAGRPVDSSRRGPSPISNPPTKPDRPQSQGDFDHRWEASRAPSIPPSSASPPSTDTLDSEVEELPHGRAPILPKVHVIEPEDEMDLEPAEMDLHPVGMAARPAVPDSLPPPAMPEEELDLAPPDVDLPLEEPLPGEEPLAELEELGAASLPPDEPAPSAAAPGDGAPEEDADDGRTRAYSTEEHGLVARTVPPPADVLAQIEEPARPAPAAEGTFAKTPFVHLLVYVLDQRLTGTVTFYPPEELSHDVYFEQGVPAKIRTGAMIWPLDRVLVNLRLVDEAKLNEALVEISKTKMLLGRHLVARGLCGREDVLRALRLQLVYKLVSMADLPPATRYAFYANVNLIQHYGGPELLRSEPLATVMATVRASTRHPVVDATLARIAHVPLRFAAGADVARFDFSREELAICDMLRARHMRWPDLLSAGVAPEPVVRRTVYVLVITRYLELGGAQKPPVVGPATAFPSEMPPGPEGLRPSLPGVVMPAAATAPVRDTLPGAGAAAAPPRAREPSMSGVGTGPVAAAVSPAKVRESMPGVGTGPVPAAAPPKAPERRPTALGVGPSPAAPQAPGAAAPAQASAAPPTRAPAQAPAPPAAAARTATQSPVPAGAAKTATQSPVPAPAGKPAAQTPTPAAAAQSPAATTPVAGKPPVDLAARRAEIQARAATVENENYFEVLGIAKTATSEETRGAYFQLAKRWHPDRTPPELVELKPLVSTVFAKIGEAYATLGDAEKRKAYLKSLDSPPSGARNAAEEEQVARAVNAVLEFQKAEALLKKNDLLGAERHIRLASDADPGQPEYTTLLAWITALRRGEPKNLPPGAISNQYDDLIQMLDEVLRGDPRYERALFYRGTLLKRSGKADKAIRDFRLAAEINPKNLDAVREVRLFEMRKRDAKGEGGEGQGGLFGKWFKR